MKPKVRPGPELIVNGWLKTEEGSNPVILGEILIENVIGDSCEFAICKLLNEAIPPTVETVVVPCNGLGTQKHCFTVPGTGSVPNEFTLHPNTLLMNLVVKTPLAPKEIRPLHVHCPPSLAQNTGDGVNGPIANEDNDNVI
jgi:hypothetical protein